MGLKSIVKPKQGGAALRTGYWRKLGIEAQSKAHRPQSSPIRGARLNVRVQSHNPMGLGPICFLKERSTLILTCQLSLSPFKYSFQTPVGEPSLRHAGAHRWRRRSSDHGIQISKWTSLPHGPESPNQIRITNKHARTLSYHINN